MEALRQRNANCSEIELLEPPALTNIGCGCPIERRTGIGSRCQISLSGPETLVPPLMGNGAGFPRLEVKGGLKSVETHVVQLGVPPPASLRKESHLFCRRVITSSCIQTPVPASKCVLAEFCPCRLRVTRGRQHWPSCASRCRMLCQKALCCWSAFIARDRQESEPRT